MELDFIKQTVVRVLHVDEKEIGPDTTFAEDLAADSIDLCQIVVEAEKEYDIRIAEEEAFRVRSLGDLSELIHSKRRERTE